MISDLEHVERKLAQAEDGMSYNLSSTAAKAVRRILALPGVSADGPTVKAIFEAVKTLDNDLAEMYY